MRAVTMMMAMLVLGAGSALAQTALTPGPGSALGVTSPLGIAGMTANTPASPPAIPLGATQLNVGGLSPSPGPLAGTSCSTVPRGR